DQNRNRPGYSTPEKLQQYLDYKNRATRAQTQSEDLLDRQKSKVLDKVQSGMDRNLQQTLETNKDLSKQAEQARNKVFAILGQNGLFNYVKYGDGKIIRFQDGLAKVIENERVIDPHGNVSLRTTRNMLYNVKRLMTSYDAETVDSQGNKTKVLWQSGAYTDDSVYYATDQTHARKLVTGYVQDT